MKHLWRIFSTTKNLWPMYVAVSVFSISIAIIAQLQPLIVKAIIDNVTQSGASGVDLKFIGFMVAGLFAVDVGQTVFGNIGGYIGDVLGAKLRYTLGRTYFSHLLKLPQRYYDTELSGTILNRLDRSINQLTFYIQAMSNTFLQMIFSTLFSLIIVFKFSWPVGILLMLLYPLYIWLTARTSPRWRQYQTKINTELDRATGRFAEAIGQIKVVKSFDRAKDELSVFSKRMNHAIDLTKPQSKLWHKQDVLRRMVLNIIFLAVFGLIFFQLADHKITIGTAVLLLQYALNIRIPIFSISMIVDNSQRAISNSEEYFKALAEEPEQTDERPDIAVKAAEIKFSDVNFGYTTETTVLNNIKTVFKPGERTALVGESGEGKTTLTNLIMGLYEPNSGQITIDGQDINQASRESLRRSVAVVFQEPALFSGTIRENIGYGKHNAKLSEIKAAAVAANAAEFIEKFADGYNTEIGERGLKLSGGQKQRIAIARALLKDAPILILDEATSSLDSKSERLVQQALERLMHGRTTIIIAHRLSTIQTVDTIITLKDGTINEVGSPQKLAKTDGIYAKLLALQNKDTDASKAKLKAYEMEE